MDGMVVLALVALVALLTWCAWRTAGWATKGSGWRVVGGFVLYWCLGTIIGGVVFLAFYLRRKASIPAR